MSKPTTQRQRTRREFLSQAAAGLRTYGAASLLPHLALTNSALAASRPKGSVPYRALVCIDLSGGNDSWNLLVPRDGARYGVYSTARGALAVAQNQLLQVSPLSGGDYGLHPQLPQLRSLFSAGDAAFLTNVGTLIRPITKAEYNANSSLRPPQLFSHNDQTRQWMVGRSGGNPGTGWGGRVADRVDVLNNNLDVSMSLSISGRAQFLTGQSVSQYVMGTGGPANFSGYTGTSGFDTARRNALNELLNMTYDHVLVGESAAVSRSAIDVAAAINAALAQVPALTTTFDTTNSLASQLRMVARMMQTRDLLDVSRQIYYVRLGGFDTHSNQDTTQPTLYGRLDQAISQFWSALGELGLRDQVTLFTMSEFGRTMNSNGDGSDHAWGGVHLVVGGAVNGNQLYGSFPEQQLNGPQSLSRGQFIPSTSFEQYAATLARWMGVTSPTELAAIFPNLGNFATSDLGFLSA